MRCPLMGKSSSVCDYRNKPCRLHWLSPEACLRRDETGLNRPAATKVCRGPVASALAVIAILLSSGCSSNAPKDKEAVLFQLYGLWKSADDENVQIAFHRTENEYKRYAERSIRTGTWSIVESSVDGESLHLILRPLVMTVPSGQRLSVRHVELPTDYRILSIDEQILTVGIGLIDSWIDRGWLQLAREPLYPSTIRSLSELRMVLEDHGTRCLQYFDNAPSIDLTEQAFHDIPWLQ